jgi:hypothetical protein
MNMPRVPAISWSQRLCRPKLTTALEEFPPIRIPIPYLNAIDLIHIKGEPCVVS